MKRRRIRHVLIAAPDFQPWDLGTYAEAALNRFGIANSRFAYHRLEKTVDAGKAFEAAVRRSGADCVLGVKLHDVPAAAIDRVHRSGVRILLWQVDCFTDRVPRWMRERAPLVDVVAVTARGMIPAYQRLGGTPVHWVMEGAYLPAFPPVTMTPGMRRLYGSDVAFVGNIAQPPIRNVSLAGRRRQLLTRLGRRFQVRVWGPQRRWVIDGPPPHVELRRWAAYNDELSRICQASAIVLGINTINTVHQYFSNRTFVTLAARGFHITHYVPGLEELFENHRHLVWFSGDEECVDLCRHYLRRPRQRRAIAQAGHERVRRRWSLVSQVRTLTTLLEHAGA